MIRRIVLVVLATLGVLLLSAGCDRGPSNELVTIAETTLYAGHQDCRLVLSAQYPFQNVEPGFVLNRVGTDCDGELFRVELEDGSLWYVRESFVEER